MPVCASAVDFETAPVDELIGVPDIELGGCAADESCVPVDCFGYVAATAMYSFEAVVWRDCAAWTCDGASVEVGLDLLGSDG